MRINRRQRVKLVLSPQEKERYRYTPEVTPEQVMDAAMVSTGVRLLDQVGRVLAEIPVTLSGKIAEALQMDAKELNTAVKTLCGVSMHELLEMYLLRKAKRLIEHADKLDVGEVAEECGFSSSAAFGTFFERKTGKTPVEWKTGKKPYNWHRP